MDFIAEKKMKERIFNKFIEFANHQKNTFVRKMRADIFSTAGINGENLNTYIRTTINIETSRFIFSISFFLLLFLVHILRRTILLLFSKQNERKNRTKFPSKVQKKNEREKNISNNCSCAVKPKCFAFWLLLLLFMLLFLTFF